MSAIHEFKEIEEIIKKAVREIHPKLDDFFGEKAADVDFMLLDYLNNTKFSFDLTPEIVKLLKKSDGAARWLKKFFDANRLDINQFESLELKGKDSRPITAVEYICPHNKHRRVFRAKVVSPPPWCDIHNCELEREY